MSRGRDDLGPMCPVTQLTRLNNSLSACTGDNPLVKARGLSPGTGGQTVLTSTY